MMDILFYNFELENVYMIPSSSLNAGYISCNTTQDFNGDGSFEILYYDLQLKKLIKQYPDGLLIKWGKFDGIVTDYQCKQNEWRIYGTHLNGILHKEVIPNTDGEISGNLKTLVKNVIITHYPWLTWVEPSAIFEDVTFCRNDYKAGNDFIKDLVSRGHSGYRIYIDTQNKQLKFELLQSKNNTLMLSEANLNAYKFQEDYNSKTTAYGGWYKQEQPNDESGNRVEPIWTYISLNNAKIGLYKQDVILKATTAAEASAELAEYTATHTITCSTRNVKYGIDYVLGDKVRVLFDDICVQKTVTAIKSWHEGTEYNEEPVLGDLEEATNDE